MQNFIAQSMRRAALAPKNKGPVSNQSPTNKMAQNGTGADSHLQIGSKWSYSTLEYPSDIQERSDLGHYMMFYVNVHDSSRSQFSTYNAMQKKLTEQYRASFFDATRTREVKQKQEGAAEALRNQTSWSATANNDDWGEGGTWMPGKSEKVIGREHYQGRLTENIKKDQQRTVRTSDSIVLYMPPTIQTNTNSVYKSTEMGGMGMELASRVADVWSRSQQIGTWDAIMESVPGFLNQGIDDTQRGIAKAVSAIMGGDAAGAIDKLSNRAQNRFLESMFDSVGFRKFSYTFKFTPKNVNESFIARDIIKTFRFHMTPELPETGDFGRYFVIPAEFDLFYMFRGDENTWLNKISSCVLTNMDVNYANGRYQTFRPVWGKGNEGAPPTEIEMKLDFMETRIITKKEILEGY